MSRAAYEALRANAEALRAALQEERSTRFRDGTLMEQERARYDALLEKYHALRVSGANAPTPEPPAPTVEQPDTPPDEVLAAMKQISPVPDKTYEANWQYWERNKERAAASPKEFAEEILMGLSFGADWTTQTR